MFIIEILCLSFNICNLRKFIPYHEKLKSLNNDIAENIFKKKFILFLLCTISLAVLALRSLLLFTSTAGSISQYILVEFILEIVALNSLVIYNFILYTWIEILEICKNLNFISPRIVYYRNVFIALLSLLYFYTIIVTILLGIDSKIGVLTMYIFYGLGAGLCCPAVIGQVIVGIKLTKFLKGSPSFDEKKEVIRKVLIAIYGLCIYLLVVLPFGIFAIFFSPVDATFFMQSIIMLFSFFLLILSIFVSKIVNI